MRILDQLLLCGFSGEIDRAKISTLISSRPKSHFRRQKWAKRVCRELGLHTFPGVGVLAAAANGGDYVSPAIAGVIMHRTGAPGFSGDAEAFHAAQLSDA